MLMGLTLSRRARLGLLAIFLVALLALFPMRLAFGILGLDGYGISARTVAGSVWWGRMRALVVGEIPLGNVDAGVSPLRMLIGQARLGIVRDAGQGNDIRGALLAGVGGMGVSHVTGTLPLGAAAAPLPVSAVELTDLTARFAGGRCVEAEGQVHARMAGDIAGLNLSQGMRGTAKCEGEKLLLPLVSQSGLEQLDIRVGADGRYRGEFRVKTSDADLVRSLEGLGFSHAGDSLALGVEGVM